MVKHDLGEQSWIIQDDIPELPYDFEQLWSLHPEQFGQVKIYNRLVDTPRWTQCYGKSYWFSGMLHEALELPEEFDPFLLWSNLLGFGNFDQVLVNWYESHHYIGKHTDNEPQIQPNSAILCISLGAERTFRIRSKETGKIVQDFKLKDQSYIVMGGETQKHFTHEITKTSKKVGNRISLTFRIFK